MPKQCTNYEEAFHYDCALCDEKNCAFRKPPFSRNAFIVFTITLMLILMGLSYWAFALVLSTAMNKYQHKTSSY